MRSSATAIPIPISSQIIFAIGTQNLSSYVAPKSCLTNLCQVFQFAGTIQQFKTILEDQKTEIEKSIGKIVLNPSNIAEIFLQDQTELLSVSNTEIIGTIVDKFWYTFSSIGYLTIGSFKSKTPIFDLKPGYIVKRSLWHIEYHKEYKSVYFVIHRRR